VDDKQIIAPNLAKIIDTIEKYKVEIADKWVVIESIVAVFKHHNISPKKFKNGFGVPIIEYFISVVREEKLAGNCPVMSKLVKYLLDKEISPKEVFIICMGFRKMLIAFIFEKKMVNGNIKELMDELADLFDANLAGVLDIFTDLYKNQQKSLLQSAEKQTKLKQFLKIINSIHTKIMIVENGKIIMGNKSFLELNGVSNITDFYKQSVSFAVSNDKKEEGLYFISDIDDWLGNVCESKDSFNISMYNHKHKKNFIYNGRITFLPDSQPKKYIISLNNVSKFIDENNDLKTSMEYDELTGLYNLLKFESLLNDAKIFLNENNKKASLAIIDIYDLKTSSKEISDVVHNEMISEVASKIKKALKGEMFAGYLHEGRFGIYIPIDDTQIVYDWCVELFLDLNLDVHVTCALSWFDTSENVSVSFLNLYSLIEVANNAPDNQIVTDFDDIKKYEFLEDQEQFITAIKDLKELESAIYYKELPVVDNNKIIAVNKTNVVLSLKQKQFTLLNKDMLVYFKLANLGNIKAEVKSKNANNKQVILHRFRKDINSPIDRKNFRIQAHENTKVQIDFQDEIIDATLFSLSIHHMQLVSHKKEGLHIGAEADVKVQLQMNANSFETIKTTCSVEKMNKRGKEYHITLACKYLADNKSHISKYISNRQIEIVKEIQDLIS